MATYYPQNEREERMAEDMDKRVVPPDGQTLHGTIARARRRLTQEPGKFVSGADRRLMTELADALDAALSALREAEQRAEAAEDRIERLAEAIDWQVAATKFLLPYREQAEALEASLSEARQVSAQRKAEIEAHEQEIMLLGGQVSEARQERDKARKLIQDVLDEWEDEMTKEACDHCEDCGEIVMCGMHSILSELAGEVWTSGAVERDELRRRAEAAEAHLSALREGVRIVADDMWSCSHPEFTSGEQSRRVREWSVQLSTLLSPVPEDRTKTEETRVDGQR